jgi:uncharacterized protein (DUF488 family)
LKTQADYNRLFDEYERTTLDNGKIHLERILELTKRYRRIAMTCFEAEQCMCHRGRVAKQLTKLPDWAYSIEHI